MRPRFVLVVLAVVLALGAALWMLAPEKRQTVQQREPAAEPKKAQLQEATPSPPSSEVSKTTVEAARPDSQTQRSAVGGPVDLITDAQADAWQRQKAARELSKRLVPRAREALMEYLRVPQAEDEGQIGHVLKNDLMGALVYQQTPPAALPDLFEQIWRDKSQNEVIRDYAVQHLSVLYERLEEPAGWSLEQLSAGREAILRVLWEAARSSESSIAGTALLGLTRLSTSGAAINRKELAGLAARLAGDAQTQEAARISAIQVCCRLQATEALPLLVEAASWKSSSSVRLSAIGGLGLMGVREQVPLLEEVVREGDPRLQPAATLALNRIRERMGSR